MAPRKMPKQHDITVHRDTVRKELEVDAADGEDP